MVKSKDNKNKYSCSFCGKPEDEVTKLVASGEDACICDSCIHICNDLLTEETIINSSEAFLVPPEEIIEYLDDYVVGQEEAKEILSFGVYSHYLRISHNALTKIHRKTIELDKSNILLIGATGSGKTYLVKHIADYLKVPFASADATTITEAGYIGGDVEEVLSRLIYDADGDINRAENGIVFIDEVDKLARRSDTATSGRDVGGESVQQALLKMVEGTIVSVPKHGVRATPGTQTMDIDTSNILFIFSGAFVGLDKIISKRINTRSMGFGAEIFSDKKDFKYTSDDIQSEDLHKYGLIPELVGRIPVIAKLRDLTEEDLYRILVEPKNSIIEQYKILANLAGISLTFSEDMVKEIASAAYKNKTGARGLRSILEKTVRPKFIEALSNRDKTINIQTIKI